MVDTDSQNKKFYLDQHGCAKNQVDGEILVTRLENIGYIKTDEPSHADFIIINSCGFISSAKEESLNAVIDAKKSYPNAKILLAGCLAERYASVLEKELSEADGFFGNGDLSKIDGTVKSLLDGGRPVVVPPQTGVCCGDRNTLLSFKGSAYVKITEGCDNRCTFCAIPIIRGGLRSRKAEDIVQEIKSLIKKGVHEINLIGQDLAAFGAGKSDDVFDDGTNTYSKLFETLREPLIETCGEKSSEEKSCL
ncbi:MAG: radical SAM protein, partial [Treponema sp.]|nr:radical SAM protein [Treponema sp.]